ncbi:MAG: helix-turn-helix transcriptional regulator [Clostridiales bacterium]|jgi:putative transcriptional regulator|nr:helix-turn-helix transcriptional regulator [Clostridiales bacterium]
MIKINLDVMMIKRNLGLMELAEQMNITPANLSILKNNKGRAIRFTTLDAACKALMCQPGDILEYIEYDEESETNEQ